MAPIKIGRPAVAIALFVGFGAPISGKADAIDPKGIRILIRKPQPC